MWRPHVPGKVPCSSGAKCSLPQLPSNTSLVASRPGLHRDQLLKLDDELVCTIGDNLSKIPSATRSTMRHLTSRHNEVSRWQAQISETIGQVNREITAVEQVKSTTDGVLEVKLLYGQLMAECMGTQNTLKTSVLAQDDVHRELTNEVQLTDEIIKVLQNESCILLDKLGSLRKIHAQLLADYRDKDEAIKLTSKCITRDMASASSQRPSKSGYVSYENWESHCKDIKLTADNIVKDSSSFRRNLQYTLARVKNTHERQRHQTACVMQRNINEMTKVQERLRWERQKTMDEIQDLTNDTHKVLGQIRNCESKLHQTNHYLEFLNQRPSRELCLDRPYKSLMMEKDDLTKMASGMQPTLECCQRDMEPMRRRLSAVEDRLEANAHALKVEQKCCNLHQSFLPLHTTTVVAPNKAGLCQGPVPSSHYAFLQ